MKRTADYTFDFRETIKPFGLLQVIKHLKEMEPNEIIEILCVEADDKSDIFKILPSAFYKLICMEQLENRLYRIQLEKMR